VLAWGDAFPSLGHIAPIVHTYRSGESGLFVNSFLVEGAEGVVAIDAPLLLSDGRAFRARLEALRKPLLGVLVTHPHPDHYNTITELLAGDEVPVIAHADVDREIRANDDAKRAQWGPMFGDEWPDSATFPNRTVADEDSVELGGLRFTAWDFGPCESESETVWLLGDGDIAFVGDLAFNGTHAYLADGHTDAWLRAIDRAEEALGGVRTLYVGHGPPAVPAVFADQRRYLLIVREAVARVAGDRAQLSEDAANGVARLMERYLPAAPLSWLVSAGATAVAAELAQETAAA
jgi:glyoxylase-like metal-dependent hydrolase (beta-lactamase superfamily II)